MRAETARQLHGCGKINATAGESPARTQNNNKNERG